MTKRKPLGWIDTGHGATMLPDCDECANLMRNPLFVEAVYSTSIESGGNPTDMARGALALWHADKHQGM